MIYRITKLLSYVDDESQCLYSLFGSDEQVPEKIQVVIVSDLAKSKRVYSVTENRKSRPLIIWDKSMGRIENDSFIFEARLNGIDAIIVPSDAYIYCNRAKGNYGTELYLVCGLQLIFYVTQSWDAVDLLKVDLIYAMFFCGLNIGNAQELFGIVGSKYNNKENNDIYLLILCDSKNKVFSIVQAIPEKNDFKSVQKPKSGGFISLPEECIETLNDNTEMENLVLIKI